MQQSFVHIDLDFLPSLLKLFMVDDAGVSPWVDATDLTVCSRQVVMALEQERREERRVVHKVCKVWVRSISC